MKMKTSNLMSIHLNNGYTLIEVIVALSLLIVILGICGSFIVPMLGIYDTNIEIAETSSILNKIADILENEIKYSKEIIVEKYNGNNLNGLIHKYKNRKVLFVDDSGYLKYYDNEIKAFFSDDYYDDNKINIDILEEKCSNQKLVLKISLIKNDKVLKSMDFSINLLNCNDLSIFNGNYKAIAIIY